MTSPIGRGALKFTQIVARKTGSLSGRVVRQGIQASATLKTLYVGAIGISAIAGGVKGSTELISYETEDASVIILGINGIFGFIAGGAAGAVMTAAFPLTILIGGIHLINKKT